MNAVDKMEKNIVLTGFMACGKTTVGQLLAGSLHRTFIDTDAYISAKVGMSVAEIFTLHRGEEAFREMERQVATLLADQQGLIIATGGKMLLDPVNVETLQRTGVIICLTATVEEIYRRVLADEGPLRPLLSGSNPKERIRVLLDERKASYGVFSQVMTDKKTPEVVVEEILQSLIDLES